MSVIRVRVASLALLVCAGAGCGNGSSQGGRDGGQDGSQDGGHDEPGDTDAAVVTDAPANTDMAVNTDAPTMDMRMVVGPRSYVVQSTFTPTTDGGAISPPPTGHTFTLVLVPEAGYGVAGSDVSQANVSFANTSGQTFRTTAPMSMGLGFGCVSSVNYTDLTFTLTPDGLTGVGQGRVVWALSDVAQVVDVTMTLTGQLDVVPPTLVGSGGTDPLMGFSLRASEPLPTEVMLSLTAVGAQPIALMPSTLTGALPAVVGFQKPGVVLRYGTTYRVGWGMVRDFAGNAPAPTSTIEFTTRAAPPLVPEDGFESATGATLGGGELVSGTGAITGSKSLLTRGGSFGAAGASPFTVRLALQPSDTVLRFSYQLVRSQPSGYTVAPTLVLGSVGGTTANTVLNPDASTYTEARLETGQSIFVGPTTAAEIRLPSGSGDEVVLQYVAAPFGCGLPPPPPAGVLIDDLRAE